MIDKIKQALAKTNVTAWQIQEFRKVSYQSFLAKEERECTRTVDSTFYEVTVHKKRREKTKDVLGMATFRIGPLEIADIEKKIEEALFSCELVANEPFALPEPVKHYPLVDIDDAKADASVLMVLEDRLRAAVGKEKKTRLSAAEFFVNRLQARLLNSNGVDTAQQSTQFHTEFVLLSKAGGNENEFINRTTRRFLRDFDIEGEVAQSAQFARDATVASLPQTGTFPVLLSDEPLDHLYNPLVAKASARLKYNKMITTELGRSVVAEGELKGDAITLWSNGLLPRAVGSARYDSYGTPSNRVCLIEKNKLKSYLADKRYADYLKVPVTGALGNVEVEPGQTAFQDLLNIAPSKSPILYHLQAFSAFEPNPITGAFSAEIRAGYELTSQGVRPIKGGSVSGVLQEALLDCRLSRETTQREHVFVPKGILFQALTIAGK